MQKKILTLHNLYSRGRYVEEVSLCMPINFVQNGAVWETISSIDLWEMQWNVVDVVKEISLTLVHKLKGEYDAIKGASKVVF